MFNRKAPACHYTDGGRIYCAARKTDLDAEHCLACPQLLDARQDKDGVVVIRCTGAAPPDPDTEGHGQ